MKISIENFKTIKCLNEFEIKPFNVLSGVNSAGKSSFIQLLLLMKQTIEVNSPNYQIFLKGDWFKVKKFKNILHNYTDENLLKVSFLVNKSEFTNASKSSIISLFNSIGDYDCKFEVEFKQIEGLIKVSYLKVNFRFDRSDSKWIELNLQKGTEYSIETNNPAFIGGSQNILKNVEVNFNSIFPKSLNYKKENKTLDIDGKPALESEYISTAFKLEYIEEVISRYFKDLKYIGPIRHTPLKDYSISEIGKDVGKEGEYTAELLATKKDLPIVYSELKEENDSFEFIEKEKSLIECVKYWICEKFNIAEDIYSKSNGELYDIMVVQHGGLEVNIRHVGFGISQILPIVVQGLLTPKNGTFIIEQPEIHLHPKVQSLIYDFLYSLTLNKRSIIVETHSSHLITRMRRRIAEDSSDLMDDQISLTFIEDNTFKTLTIDDYGILDHYPKNFIEAETSELSAIVKAQMKKKIRAKNDN